MSTTTQRSFPRSRKAASTDCASASVEDLTTPSSHGATGRATITSATTPTASATTTRCGATRTTRPEALYYGGIVALPSFPVRHQSIVSGYVGEKPAGRACRNGRARTGRGTSHSPQRRHPREAYLKDLIEHQTRFAGRAVNQIYHVDFFNQTGDKVAGRRWCLRARPCARGRRKYKDVRARDPRRYTDEGAGRGLPALPQRGNPRRHAALLERTCGRARSYPCSRADDRDGFIAYAQGWGGLCTSRANKLAWKLIKPAPGALGIRTASASRTAPSACTGKTSRWKWAHPAPDYGPSALRGSRTT